MAIILTFNITNEGSRFVGRDKAPRKLLEMISEPEPGVYVLRLPVGPYPENFSIKGNTVFYKKTWIGTLDKAIESPSTDVTYNIHLNHDANSLLIEYARLFEPKPPEKPYSLAGLFAETALGVYRGLREEYAASRRRMRGEETPVSENSMR